MKTPLFTIRISKEHREALRRRCARLGFETVSAMIRSLALKELDYEKAQPTEEAQQLPSPEAFPY